METQKTVLIVEDEETIRQALRDVLLEKKYLVLEAKNGEEGVSMALEKHPDIILLDLLMPRMNGMTAFKHIREDEWGKNVSVIILTNVSATQEELIQDIVTHKPLEYLIKSDWKIYDVVKKVGELLKT